MDVVFQATLILVLFTDAAALHFSSWRKDAALPGRLLGIGLPITIALGALIAAVLFTDLSFWEAAIIGAIVAPTDAALGQAVISNPALLALTIARMGPVALSMIGANMQPATTLYIGWFGPRRLATIVFAALVVTDADLPGTVTIVTVATITWDSASFCMG